MPVASHKPTAPPPLPSAIPVINDVRGNSPVVDTRRTPLASLITYVEGSNYVIDYYSQVLTRDSSLYAQDTNQSAEYQQYRKINRLEIKMTSPLQSDQNKENKQFTVKGTGIIHLSVIPNEGDMFCGDVGDGREGVFQVDSSSQLTFRQESAYEIEFTLLYFSSEEPERRNDLQLKTIVELHYVAEFAQSGQNPLVSTDQLRNIEELRYRYGKLVDQYFRQFLSKEFGTIIMPGQVQVVYDSFLPVYLRSVLRVEEHPQLMRMLIPNVGDDNVLTQPQFFEMLTRRDIGMLDYVNKRMGVVQAAAFTRDPMMAGVRYSGVDEVIYPLFLNQPIDHTRNALVKTALNAEFRDVSTLAGNLATLDTIGTISIAGTPMPLIYPVLKDDYYVLSEAFYERKQPKSLLEVLTENYLQREDNRPDEVLRLVESVPKWGQLEQYYYIPVLFILIKAVLKDF